MNIKDARVAMEEAKASYEESKRVFIRLRLDEVYRKEMELPHWKDWIGECTLCGDFSLNFCPTTHPKYLYDGIGCCECGTSYSVKDKSLNSHVVRDQRTCMANLYGLGFSEIESLELISIYGTYRIINNIRF